MTAASARRAQGVSSASANVIRLPMPHAGQRLVRRQMRRWNFLCAGRRWRKTTLAMPYMVEQALEAPRYAEFVWAAPVYKQVRRGWDEMKRACGGVVRFNESLMDATFPGGAVIHFLSMENFDNTRGYTSFGTVIDEASEVAEEAYRSVLRPMLSDTGGWLLAFGTPKGYNWFGIETAAVLAGEREESMAWQIPTLGARVVTDERDASVTLERAPHPLENAHFPWAELLNEFRSQPLNVFRQEYLAELVTDGGAAFQNLAACVTATPRTAPRNGAEVYVLGVDLAKHDDYTVVSVFDQLKREQVALERWNRCEWPLTKARIIALAMAWNNAMVYLDATGLGDPIFDDLARAGLRIHGYKITAQTRTPLLENLILLVEQQKVGLLDVAVQLNEMRAMQPTRLPSGLIRYDVPGGMHDDCVFANALAALPLANDHRALPPEAIDALRMPGLAFGGTGLMGKTF